MFVKRLVTPVKATSLFEMASGFPVISGFTESCQLALHNDCEWCLLPLYNLHNHTQQPCFRELTWVELENGRVQILWPCLYCTESFSMFTELILAPEFQLLFDTSPASTFPPFPAPMSPIPRLCCLYEIFSDLI